MSLSDEDLDPFERARYVEMEREIADYYRSGGAELDRLQSRGMSSGVAEERILSPDEVDEARRAGAVFVTLMRKIRSAMRSRDQVYYELGLRAAHLEEALAQGDVARAEAHYRRILEIARMLRP
jgi:hypothetical protein